jgi:UDP-N-acetylmuramoylalanine--D-glutamate ligase
MDASVYFRDKKITVMGLGLLGRGVGDAKFLAQCGAELIVTDLKSKEELADSVAQLEAFKNIMFVLGKHREEDFRNRDFILKAAGVPSDSPYIAEAKRNGIPVRMSADLFAEIAKISIVGITGTRGKSTVTHMIHAILKEAGKLVILGGNVRGVSTLSLLPEITSEHTAVLELDSWQCQGWGEAHMSPHIAVFTTFYPDHLNYYHDNLDTYLSDKAQIFLNQTEKDILILGKQCAPIIIEKYADVIRSHTRVADELKLPDTWALAIPGMHNRYDAALALEAARSLGINDDISRKALESFKGVPGRLELVREVKGIKIYNDTTATTPEATTAALEALDPLRKQNIILIMGGADKGLEMTMKLMPAIEAHAKKVFYLAGTGTDKIKGENDVVYTSLKDAVDAAYAAAEKGDSLLLSPAFASFGMFKNEFDRGDQFNAIVEKL